MTSPEMREWARIAGFLQSPRGLDGPRPVAQWMERCVSFCKTATGYYDRRFWKGLRGRAFLDRTRLIEGLIVHGRSRTDADQMIAQHVALMSMWSETKWICHFDESLSKELSLASLDDVPTNALRRLPVDAFVVVTCTAVDLWAIDHLIGSAYWYSVDPERRKESMGAVVPFQDHARYEGHSTDRVAAAMSRALYLCSEQPDIDQLPATKRYVSLKPTRKVAAQRITVSRVGFRIGAVLRIHAERRATPDIVGVSGNSVQPHLRRAHWHSYWIGSEKLGTRTRTLRWLHPILVNASGSDDLPVTARPVE